EIRELIKSLAGEHTVILSTHILPEVTATCPRVIIIAGGRIVAQDELSRLTDKYNTASALVLEARSISDAAISAIRSVTGVKAVSSSGKRVNIELDPSAGEVRDKI